MFADNDWYGHKKTLLEFCNIKKYKYIYGTLQHGYYFPFKASARFKPSKYAKNAPFFSWNNFLKNTNLNLKPIGSPFLYLHKMNGRKKFKESGTIIFPSHSNKEYPQTVSHLELIKFIKKKFKKPFKVNLYYTDYMDKKITKLYKQHDFNILCCGHRGDKNFLKKVYKNIVQSEFLVFTEFMTPTLYGMFLKKKLAIYENNKKKGNKFYLYTSIDYLKFRKKNNEFFNKKLTSRLEIEKNFEFAKKELGFKYLKKKNDLINILGLNNKYKIFLSFIIGKLYNIKYGVEERGVNLNKNFKRKSVKKNISSQLILKHKNLAR